VLPWGGTADSKGWLHRCPGRAWCGWSGDECPRTAGFQPVDAAACWCRRIRPASSRGRVRGRPRIWFRPWT